MGSIINVGVAEKNSAVSTFFYEKKIEHKHNPPYN